MANKETGVIGEVDVVVYVLPFAGELNVTTSGTIANVMLEFAKRPDVLAVATAVKKTLLFAVAEFAAPTTPLHVPVELNARLPVYEDTFDENLTP